MARLENRRLELRLTQKAVANALGVSQPHYSKIVGGLVPLTPQRAAVVEEWLSEASHDRPVPPDGERTRRIRQISRLIQAQMRELESLLATDGVDRGRRPQPRHRSN